eukprot:1173652-Prorocentrum_minimum.AAC.1
MWRAGWVTGRFMDRQGGWGSCVGKDNQLACSKHMDKAEHGGSTHTNTHEHTHEYTHTRVHTHTHTGDTRWTGPTGRGPDEGNTHTHTDARASGPPSQRKKGRFRTLHQSFLQNTFEKSMGKGGRRWWLGYFGRARGEGRARASAFTPSCPGPSCQVRGHDGSTLALGSTQGPFSLVLTPLLPLPGRVGGKRLTWKQSPSHLTVYRVQCTYARTIYI